MLLSLHARNRAIITRNEMHNLCGSLQLINHSCKDYNALIVPGANNRAHLKVVRDVAPNDEILINYGHLVGNRGSEFWTNGTCSCCITNLSEFAESMMIDD